MLKRKRAHGNGTDSDTDSENDATGSQSLSTANGRQLNALGLVQKKARKEKENGKLWTVQEVILLLNSIKQHGLTETVWAQVARAVPGRSGKQVRGKAVQQ